jgi:hypothetical protein
LIENCAGGGVVVSPTSSGSALAVLDGVQAVGNSVGIKAQGNCDVTVFNCTASNNSSHGLQAAATAAATTLNVEGGAAANNGGNGVQTQGSGGVGATANVANLGATGNAQTAFGMANPGNSFLTVFGPTQRFIESLYLDFLKRSGDVTNVSDAGVWVNALKNGTLTQAQVANNITRTAEAYGVLVDGLYWKLLNRAADPTGRAGYVSALQMGATEEQVISSIIATPEYNGLFPSDTAFVQSLYSKLLGRAPMGGELSSSLSALAMVGRAGLTNAFLGSLEFRRDVVQALYGYTLAPASSVARLLPPVLHRPQAPMQGEIDSWAGSNLDMLSLAITLAGTPEAFNVA